METRTCLLESVIPFDEKNMINIYGKQNILTFSIQNIYESLENVNDTFSVVFSKLTMLDQIW